MVKTNVFISSASRVKDYRYCSGLRLIAVEATAKGCGMALCRSRNR